MNEKNNCKKTKRRVIAFLCAISLCFSSFFAVSCSIPKEEDTEDVKVSVLETAYTSSETDEIENEDGEESENDKGEFKKTEVWTNSVYMDFEDFMIGSNYSLVTLAETMMPYLGISNQNMGFEFEGMTEVNGRRFYSVGQTYKGTPVIGCAITFVTEDSVVKGYTSKLVNIEKNVAKPDKLYWESINKIVTDHVGNGAQVELFSLDFFANDNIGYYVGENYEGFVHYVDVYVNNDPCNVLISADKEEVILCNSMLRGYKVQDKDVYIYDANGSDFDLNIEMTAIDEEGNRYSAIPGTSPVRFRTESGEEAIIDESTDIFYLATDTEKSNPLGTFTSGEKEYSVTSNTDTPINENVSNEPAAQYIEELVEKSYDFYETLFGRRGFDNNDGKVHVLYNWPGNDRFKGGQNLTKFGADTTVISVEGDEVSPDTFGHEYAHSVDISTSDPDGNSAERGAIMEAIADVFGELFQDYFDDEQLNGSDIDWKHGDRNIKNPKKSKNPVKYDGDYWDENGKQHQNSTVVSHMLYNLVSESGEGEPFTLTELAELLYMLINLMKSNSDCTIQEFCDYMLLAARSEDISSEKLVRVQESIVDAGIICDDFYFYMLVSPDAPFELYDKNGEPVTNYTVVIDGSISNSDTTIPTAYNKTVTCDGDIVDPFDYLDLKEGMYRYTIYVPSDGSGEKYTQSVIITENGGLQCLQIDTEFDPSDYEDPEGSEESPPETEKPEYSDKEDSTASELTAESLIPDGPMADVTCTIEDGVLTVYGEGKLPDYSDDITLPWSNDDYFTKVIISEGITYVGSKLFRYNDNITSVELADSVVALGEEVFYDCDEISEFDFGNGLKLIGDSCFGGYGNKLTSIELPDSLIWIGKHAFYNCVNTESIKLSANLKVIDRGAFDYMTGLSEIILPDSLEVIGESAFKDCYNITSFHIPASVKEIGPMAFGYMTLESITVDENSEHFTVVDGILYTKDMSEIVRCPSKITMTSFTVPAEVKIIKGGAFMGCSDLTEVILCDGIERINDYAFWGCSSITSLKIPEEVSYLGEGVFKECESLETVNLPESVTVIRDYTFYNCRSLKSIELNEDTTWIGMGAFTLCFSLESISIPDSVTGISTKAFFACTIIKNISIPEGIVTVEEQLFADCHQLETVDLPSTINEIESGAFYCCESLKEINFNGTIEE